DEADAVDAGDGCEAREQRIVDLGVAEQVPGQAGDAGASEFDGDPEEWREQQRALDSKTRAAQRGHQGGEDGVVKAEIEAEEDEDSGADVLRETAEEVHGLVDPVAVTEVPEEAAQITEKR